MDDSILISLLVLLLVVCLLSSSLNKSPFEATVIDKYIRHSRYSESYVLTLKSGDKIFDKCVSHYDFVYGYFIGETYVFEY